MRRKTYTECVCVCLDSFSSSEDFQFKSYLRNENLPKDLELVEGKTGNWISRLFQEELPP